MKRFIASLSATLIALLAIFAYGTPATAASTFTPSAISTNTTGTTVTVSYAVTLDPTSGGTAAEFTLRVAGVAYPSASMTRSITNGSVILTLSGTPIANGQSVTLAYTRASAQTKILQSGSSNYAADFAATSVTNNVPVPDMTPPTASSFATNTAGTSISIVYNEPLLTSSVPAASDFVLNVAGSTYLNTSYTVAIAASTVTLSLTGAAISNGQLISLTYTGGTNKIKDVAGNIAANYSGASVTNNVPDTTPPSQISRSTNTAGTQIIATFNETLDATSVPTNTDIQIFLNGQAYTNFSVSISGSRVIMTLLGAAIQHGQVVTLNYTPGLVNNRVRDLAKNEIGSVVGAEYVNIVPDLVPPGLLTKSTNTAGTVVTLGFNETLLSTAVPSASDFTLKVSGSTYSSANIAISLSGSSALLTLSGAAIQPGQTVTIGYAPGLNKMQDEHGNTVIAFTDQLVANNSTDTRAPLPLTQSTNQAGTAITITFDEALKLDSIPAASDFSITKNGSAYTGGFTVNLSDSLVELALSGSNHFLATDVLLVSYTPGTNKLKDQAGNNVAAISNAAVSNNVPDVSAPVLTNITTNTTGSVVSLNFAEALDATSVPTATNFTLKIDGATYSTAQITVGVSGSVVTLTLASAAIANGSVVTLSYSGTAIKAFDNGVSAGSFTSLNAVNNVRDTTPPQQIFRGSDSTGYQLITTYNEPIDPTSVPDPTDYQVYVDGVLSPVASVVITGADSIKYLVTPVRYGQTIVLNYTPGVHVLRDLAGNAIGSVSNQVVQNLVPDTTAPTVLSRITNNTGTQITMAASEALDASSVPAASDFVLKVGGVTYPSSSYTVSIVDNDLVLFVLSGTPINFGQNIVLSYTAGTNKLRDVAGNLMANFTNQLVSNLVPDSSTPLLASSDSNSLGTKIILGFNEPLDAGSVPVPADFNITVDGATLALSKYTVAVTGQNVEITLVGGALIPAGAIVLLSYVPGTHKIRDLAQNTALAIVNGIVNNNVPDTTGPVITLEPIIRVVQGRTSVGVATANELATWTIRNDAAHIFSINSATGEIFVSASASLGSYTLEITATDFSLNSTDKIIQVVIFTSDYPVIDAPANVSIVQGATAVAKPTSSDADVVWAIVSNSSGFFAINRTTGEITASASAVPGVYSFVYSATDEAGFISEGWMIITVTAPPSSGGGSEPSTPAPISAPNTPVSATLTSETKVDIRAGIAVGGTVKNVTFSVQERGTPAGTSMYLFPGMSEADDQAGQLIVEIKAFNVRGIALHQFSKTMSLEIGAAPTGQVPAHSDDGINWNALPLLPSPELTSGLSDGYYIDGLGRTVILTRHLSYFGFKKPVSKFELIADRTVLKIGQTEAMHLIQPRGTVTSVIKTLTPYICPLVGNRTVLAYTSGICQIIAVMPTDDVHVGVSSKVIRIKIEARKKSIKR